jgi:hypothetical protein
VTKRLIRPGFSFWLHVRGSVEDPLITNAWSFGPTPGAEDEEEYYHYIGIGMRMIASARSRGTSHL